MKKILILGGDIRNFELAKKLKKENKVILYGFEKLDQQLIKENLQEALKRVDTIITPIPISKDGTNVILPFSTEQLIIEKFVQTCEGKNIITGNISVDYKEKLEEKNNTVTDILKLEEYAILNAQPTAEGAIQVAMENTNKVLQNSNVLIIGYGKIGKILAKILKLLNCNVFCTARKETDFAMMQANAINTVQYKDLNQVLGKMDIIFNTVPTHILNEAELLNVKKEAVIIELASKPGGINLEAAEKLKLNVINAQGLPGKVAPVTAAEIIAKISQKYL